MTRLELLIELLKFRLEIARGEIAEKGVVLQQHGEQLDGSFSHNRRFVFQSVHGERDHAVKMADRNDAILCEKCPRFQSRRASKGSHIVDALGQD